MANTKATVDVTKFQSEDPGPEKPIWTGGPPSGFVLALPLMERRAKSAGVFKIWTGEESVHYSVPETKMDMFFDENFETPTTLASSADGIAILERCKAVDADASTGTPARPATPTFHVGRVITDADPYFHPSNGQLCPETGLMYKATVPRVSDRMLFDKRVDALIKRSMDRVDQLRKHEVLMQKAEAVMLGCLSSGVQSTVTHMLRDGHIREAWVALRDKYLPDDAKAVTQLNAHLRCLRLTDKYQLDQYLNSFDTLCDALASLNEYKDDESKAELIEAGIIASSGNVEVDRRNDYYEVFSSYRLNDWSLSQLIDRLERVSRYLYQQQGIKQVEDLVYSREKKLRGDVGERRSSAMNATSTIVAGSDDKSHPNIDCYKCHQKGHYRVKCPLLVVDASNGGTTGDGSTSGGNRNDGEPDDLVAVTWLHDS